MLNGAQIKELIRHKKLVEGYIDLDAQVTQNGIDLTVSQVFSYEGKGSVDLTNAERKLPECKEVPFIAGEPEWWDLPAGCYKVRTNEVINMPKDLAGTAYTRSTLLRCGVFVQNGVWDAGFSGRSEFMLVVANPKGFKIKKNARVLQLTFHTINEVEQGYNGIYQGTK